jgi:hypothetical protein
MNLYGHYQSDMPAMIRDGAKAFPLPLIAIAFFDSYCGRTSGSLNDS